jgi:hypothetical protein
MELFVNPYLLGNKAHYSEATMMERSHEETQKEKQIQRSPLFMSSSARTFLDNSQTYE